MYSIILLLVIGIIFLNKYFPVIFNDYVLLNVAATLLYATPYNMHN